MGMVFIFGVLGDFVWVSCSWIGLLRVIIFKFENWFFLKIL